MSSPNQNPPIGPKAPASPLTGIVSVYVPPYRPRPKTKRYLHLNLTQVVHAAIWTRLYRMTPHDNPGLLRRSHDFKPGTLVLTATEGQEDFDQDVQLARLLRDAAAARLAEDSEPLTPPVRAAIRDFLLQLDPFLETSAIQRLATMGHGLEPDPIVEIL